MACLTSSGVARRSPGKVGVTRGDTAGNLGTPNPPLGDPHHPTPDPRGCPPPILRPPWVAPSLIPPLQGCRGPPWGHPKHFWDLRGCPPPFLGHPWVPPTLIPTTSGMSRTPVGVPPPSSHFPRDVADPRGDTPSILGTPNPPVGAPSAPPRTPVGAPHPPRHVTDLRGDTPGTLGTPSPPTPSRTPVGAPAHPTLQRSRTAHARGARTPRSLSRHSGRGGHEWGPVGAAGEPRDLRQPIGARVT